MKLGDGHDEGQGNPKEEVALPYKGLRSLLGLAIYYHHFIQDFFKVARTLPDLLEEKKMVIPRVG
jgi:hypothetical protein